MSLNAHLAVQRNAFSTAATAPKLCDGRVSHSCTLREAGVTVTKTEDTEALFFCLFPCITGGFWSMDTAGANMKFHVAGSENFLNGVGNAKNAPDQAADKFRLVSAGMRLSCINASENNEGYFEAVRYVTDGRDIDFINMTQGTATVKIPNTALTGASQLGSGILTSSRWPNHPTYVTGKLRDLYKHMFYLQPQQDREMNQLDPTLKDYGFDKNFDMILVKVSAIPTSTVPIAVHAHTVHNWEVQYDANQSSSRYHSPCMSFPSAVRAVDKALKRDPKASQIRSPNQYGYKPRY